MHEREKKWSDGEKAAQTNWRMLLFFERFTLNGKTHQEKWMKIEHAYARAMEKQKERMNKRKKLNELQGNIWRVACHNDINIKQTWSA